MEARDPGPCGASRQARRGEEAGRKRWQRGRGRASGSFRGPLFSGPARCFSDAESPPYVRESDRPSPLPDRGRGAPQRAAGRRLARVRPGKTRAREQHLDRRAHPRLGLLLLRRDPRSVLPGGAPRQRHRARRHQERRLRHHRQRPLQGLRQLPRDRALLRARGGHPGRRRPEHREDLRAKLPEHRPAHDHRLRPRGSPRGRRRGVHRRVHPWPRSGERGRRRLRRPVCVQRGAPRGGGHAPPPSPRPRAR